MPFSKWGQRSIPIWEDREHAHERWCRSSGEETLSYFSNEEELKPGLTEWSDTHVGQSRWRKWMTGVLSRYRKMGNFIS